MTTKDEGIGLLRVATVAQLLRCSKSLVYRMAKRGQLPCVTWPCPAKDGGKPRQVLRFKKGDILDFIKSHYRREGANVSKNNETDNGDITAPPSSAQGDLPKLDPGIEGNESIAEERRTEAEEFDPIKARERTRDMTLKAGKDV